jgi:transcriptional regulator with XRE-family HTH domain
MDLFTYIGDRIRKLRTARDLSQEELGREVGVPTNTISRWETATYRPDVAELDRLARFFGVSILDFFPDREASQDEKLVALLRAAKDLHADDLEELRRYAEFRRARHFYARAPRRRRKASS